MGKSRRESWRASELSREARNGQFSYRASEQVSLVKSFGANLVEILEVCKPRREPRSKRALWRALERTSLVERTLWE